MKKTKTSNSGFSLVELIIVIAIMAILAGAVAPALIKYIERTRESRFLTDAKTILDDARADYASFLGGDSDDSQVQSGVPTSIGKIHGVDCDKVIVADPTQELDLSSVSTPSDNAIFYVDPLSGNIVGCVYNNGRYTGYWKEPDPTNEWVVNKN